MALERKAQGAAGGGEFVEAHVPEFRFGEAEVTETEGEMFAIRFRLREQPSGVRVRGDDLHDRFEVDRLVLAVDGKRQHVDTLRYPARAALPKDPPGRRGLAF
jgi:hypothetical protein